MTLNRNNTQILGYLNLFPIPQADFSLITPPSFGVGTIANNADTNTTDRWDGTSWVSFATTADIHPAAFVGTVGSESSYLTIDPTTQEVNFAIPTGTFYTQTEVDQLLSDLVGGAGAAYDTLQELAAEIQANDADLITVLSDIADNDSDIAALQAQIHPAAAVAAGSFAGLTIDATTQEVSLDLTSVLADVATNTAARHDEVTLAAVYPELTLVDQELTLDLSDIKADIIANAEDIVENQVTINNRSVDFNLENVLADNINNIPYFFQVNPLMSATSIDVTIDNGTIFTTIDGVSIDTVSTSVTIPMGALVRSWRTGMIFHVAYNTTAFDGSIYETFAAGDFVAGAAGSNEQVYVVTDARIDIGKVFSVEVYNGSNRREFTDYEVKSGSLEIIVNAVPDASFAGSVAITTVE